MEDTKQLEIKALTEAIIKLHDEYDSMEKELAMPKLMRQLYKALGEPNINDYDESTRKHLCSHPDRVTGYTKYPNIGYASIMESHNYGSTTWHINRASQIKERIEEEYTRDGWHVEVYAYNVLCSKYVRHPKYEGIWVYFYVSRDCCKYGYAIERGE